MMFKCALIRLLTAWRNVISCNLKHKAVIGEIGELKLHALSWCTFISHLTLQQIFVQIRFLSSVCFWIKNRLLSVGRGERDQGHVQCDSSFFFLCSTNKHKKNNSGKFHVNKKCLPLQMGSRFVSFRCCCSCYYCWGNPLLLIMRLANTSSCETRYLSPIIALKLCLVVEISQVTLSDQRPILRKHREIR